MLPASFDESNVVIDKPESMTRDECDALSAWRGTVDGHPVLISCWKPTKEELEKSTGPAAYGSGYGATACRRCP